MLRTQIPREDKMRRTAQQSRKESNKNPPKKFRGQMIAAFFLSSVYAIIGGTGKACPPIQRNFQAGQALLCHVSQLYLLFTKSNWYSVRVGS
jgi:branched-subunit amino acid permease